MREYRAWKKSIAKYPLNAEFMGWECSIETLLMTAQINTDFVNRLRVPSTTEPSTILVHVATNACESMINSILRYKD
ncbi:hypothetical protein TNCV_1893981 [Trichonephila clavipes]|nr:hypothetical protein TNCV_1893981 [Trichonephila clavipes]